MANFSVYLGLSFLLLVTFTSAQQTWTCPSSGSSVCYCNVYVNVPGFKLDCGGRYGPEQIKSQIEFYSSYGPIHTLIISSIEQSSFSYVPDNFLAGVQISDVTFKCFHYNSVNSGLLSFSAYAFTDETGTCGLTGNLTITDCNIRQFYSADLNNCNQLTKLAFVNSHVESIIDIPTLSSLKNFTVYYPLIWNGASQRGLSRLTLASGATLPRLRYLDLTGNSLTDESIQFIPQLTAIEEMHLEGNKFSVVPTLTASFDLHTISMTLSSNSSVSIQLPNPRTQTRSLNASFYSGNGAANEVDFLDGMFVDDVIHLKLIMTEFKESVFLAPLQTNGVTIDLNPTAKILCSCSISWLVRDNPNLLERVKNGTCTDGRPFEQIPTEEVSCCSTKSLINRLSRQQDEIETLKATVRQLQLASSGNV